MKKLNLSLLFICCLSVLSSFAQDKSFQKGKITISIGAGFGLYGTKIEQAKDSAFYAISQQGITKNSVRVNQSKNDGAASAIYPMTIEYGVRNWLGIGLRGAFSKYYANADSTNSYTKPNVGGFDADLVLNLHLIKTVRFDMPISFVFGYSNLKYEANDILHSIAKSNGLNYGISFLPRIYFGKFRHVGIYANIGYSGYNYPNFKVANDNDSNLNDNENSKLSIKGNGANLGIGLIIKI